MAHLFRPNPATDKQLERLRELARWPGLPQPESSQYVEQRIKDGLNIHEAYVLIGQYGKRIREMKESNA